MNAKEIEDYVEIIKSPVSAQGVQAVMAASPAELDHIAARPARFPVFLGFRDEWDL